jgi:hypothetical protein
MRDARISEEIIVTGTTDTERASVKKARGLIFWSLAIISVVAVLFVGSAFLAAIMDVVEKSDAQEKATSLTDVSVLQNMISAGMKEATGVPLRCWYNAAIGYRLAEARDLKIERSQAVDLANDQYLVGELAREGINSKTYIAGLANIVFDSPLPPHATFDAQLEGCARSRA